MHDLVIALAFLGLALAPVVMLLRPEMAAETETIRHPAKQPRLRQ
jgi:hypothetical protein